MEDSVGPVTEDHPNVILVTQYFHPDTSANSTILTELAIGLADRGVDISVLTTQPSYASSDRAANVPDQEEYRGVSIHRVYATRFNKNESIAHRMANELSFFIMATLYLLRRRRSGILLLPTAPPFLPILGWILDRIRGYSYVPIIYDLYPDMAVELGYLGEDGLLYSIWNRLNAIVYPRADCVITIGETMEETLVQKYGQTCTTTVIHNWEDGEFITPRDKEDNEFAIEHGLVDQLTVLYSGNLGLHHDLESVVAAADQLEQSYHDGPFTFLFIGEGGKKPTLEAMVDERDVTTVSFLPYQSRDVLPKSLTCGDVALVTMEEGVEGLCVSSKFYTALASGQAVLAIANPDSEIGRIIDRTNCGIRVDPDSPGQIVEAVSFWLQNPTEAEEMGENARALFDTEFSMDSSIDEYYEVLESIASKTS